MTREEWYRSTKFLRQRLLGHMAAEVEQKIQQMGDLLVMIDNEEGGGLLVHDRFHLVERQLRIMGLESSKLSSLISRFTDMMSPKKFDDMESPRELPQSTDQGS